ncbi:MAG TPA: UPF0158 family protein [Kofleriaceae bacterium]|nr:UPF0158 family protein [Kofleriaceae bacterium]
MSPKPITIDWDALETAVERNAPDTESFLDRSSGQVMTVVAGDPEAPLRKRQIAENIHNFVRVEPASSREQYRWMERFVSSVSEPGLRERLIISIDGKGAFRRFKDVLLAYPAERERWFSYRADLLHWHIHNWLREAGIDAAEDPPWGEAKPPPELPQVEGKPVVHGTEPPGEALRRHARDLIDGIAAIDLPSAIAFLEFLRDRGGQVLNGQDGALNDDDDPDGDQDEAPAAQRATSASAPSPAGEERAGDERAGDEKAASTGGRSGSPGGARAASGLRASDA